MVWHQCKKEDTAVRRLFPHSKLQIYNVLYIDRLLRTIRSYSYGKKCDDSNILFQLMAQKTSIVFVQFPL